MFHRMVIFALVSLVVFWNLTQAFDTITADDQAFYVGTNVELSCPVSDKNTLTWMSISDDGTASVLAIFPGDSIDADYKLDAGNLTIPNAQEKHSLCYQCYNHKQTTLPRYKLPVYIVAKLTSATIALSYTNELLQPGVTTNITCTVGKSKPAPKLRFFMRKKGSVNYAEINSGVTQGFVSSDDTEKYGARQAKLQYAFYPEHNQYDFRCQSDVSVLTSYEFKEFTPNVDGSKYTNSANKLFVSHFALLVLIVNAVFVTLMNK